MALRIGVAMAISWQFLKIDVATLLLGTGSLNFIQACSPNSFTRLWKIFMSQS
jgi:hypothetical protein